MKYNKFVPRLNLAVTARGFRRHLRKVLPIMAVAAIGSLIFYLVFRTDLLVVRNVWCRVDNPTTLADEKRWCETAKRELLGRRLLLLNEGYLSNNLSALFLPIARVTIREKPPQSVEILIFERLPVAQVATGGGSFFLTDQDGLLYSQSDGYQTSLPKVILDLGNELAFGQTLPGDITALLVLPDPKFSFIGYLNDETIEAVLQDGAGVIFSRQSDMSKQIDDFQTVLQKYRIEGKMVKEIDLRFGRPVVKY